VFGISYQIRKSALSIPTNIVEGYAGNNKKEPKQFIRIALGLHAETEYLYNFSKRLGSLKKDSSNIESLIKEVGRLLWSFNRSI